MCNFEFCKLSLHFSQKRCGWEKMKFLLQRVSIWVNIKINFKFLGSTVSEKNAMLSCKISKWFIKTIVQLWILQVIITFFSKTVRQWNMKFFCKKYLNGLIFKINFMFLGRTVLEKNATLTCKISKLFIRTIVQFWIFQYNYHRIFLKNCATKEHEIFFLKSIHMG